MATLAVEGSSALNITNAISVPALTANSLNITGNPAGLTFSGPWNLGSTVSVGSDGAANLVIISGVISGAGGFNKFSPGTLQEFHGDEHLHGQYHGQQRRSETGERRVE